MATFHLLVSGVTLLVAGLAQTDAAATKSTPNSADLPALAAPFMVEADGAAIAAKSGHAAPFACDLDGDGILDVVSGRYVPGSVYWFRGNKDGTFGKRLVLLEGTEGDMAAAMATANLVDFDKDGDLDLIVVER